jgi:hypothetical protein
MVSQETIEGRLRELHSELSDGNRALRELDARREELRVTLLRIGGAAQVLEELLATNGAAVAEP